MTAAAPKQIKGKRSTAAYREATAKLLTEHLPAIGEADALKLLEQAKAWNNNALFDLHDHLAAHADALTSGASDIPESLLRLAWLLLGEGLGGVVAPACIRCGRQARKLPMLRDGGRICYPCYRKDTRTSCARCGRETKNAHRRPDGIICASCRDAEPENQDTCPHCGYQRPLRRRPDGRMLCDNCIPRPLHKCAGCGRHREAAAKIDGIAWCQTCHAHRRARRCGGGCGHIRPISIAATATTPELCIRCRPRTVGTCSQCHRHTFVNRNQRGRGVNLCQACQPEIRRPCSRCGRSRRSWAIWPSGPVCRVCYGYAKRYPQPCPSCRTHAILVGQDAAGQRICGRCAGTERDYVCTRCHDEPAVAKSLCARCLLNDEVAELLAMAVDPDQLAGLTNALHRHRSQPGALRWLRRSTAAEALKNLLRCGQPLTHKALDTAPQTQQLHHLRHILIRTGVLPQRVEYLERIPVWLRHLLQHQTAPDADLVKRYTTWFMLHRARRRSRTRPITPAASYHLRSAIRQTLDFLRWLEDHGRTLSTLTQTDIDTWLDTGPQDRYRIRQFLHWAHQHGHAPQIDIETRPYVPKLQLLDDQEVYRQLRKCLHDNSIPLDVRVAGGLLLTYGLRMDRIARLTTTNITCSNSKVMLSIGRHPIELPPPLGKLAVRLSAQPNDQAPLSRAVGHTPHLFPGGAPGRCIRPPQLRNRLHQHGITAEPGRQTALYGLAADLPPAVLADLLGIAVSTANRWAAYTAADQGAYLQARIQVDNDDPRHSKP